MVTRLASNALRASKRSAKLGISEGAPPRNHADVRAFEASTTGIPTAPPGTAIARRVQLHSDFTLE